MRRAHKKIVTKAIELATNPPADFEKDFQAKSLEALQNERSFQAALVDLDTLVEGMNAAIAESTDQMFYLRMQLIRNAFESQAAKPDGQEDEEPAEDEGEEDAEGDEGIEELKAAKIIDKMKEDLTFITPIKKGVRALIDRHPSVRWVADGLIGIKDGVMAILGFLKNAIKTILSILGVGGIFKLILWAQKRYAWFNIISRAVLTVIWVLFVPVLGIVIWVLRFQSNPAVVAKPILGYLDLPDEWIAD